MDQGHVAEPRRIHHRLSFRITNLDPDHKREGGNFSLKCLSEIPVSMELNIRYRYLPVFNEDFYVVV
jgi:hypothetical protein